MKIILEDSAKNCLDDIYYYNYLFSLRNAKETDRDIRLFVQILEKWPYLGRFISKVSNKNFRELIRSQNKHSYRIIYFISENTNTIHIIYIANSKRDFTQFLKLNNYFKNFSIF